MLRPIHDNQFSRIRRTGMSAYPYRQKNYRVTQSMPFSAASSVYGLHIPAYTEAVTDNSTISRVKARCPLGKYGSSLPLASFLPQS